MPRPVPLQALTLKRALVSLVLTFSFLAQFGCDREAAVSLSTVGVETSTTLFTFYETLAQNTNETRELEILWVALVGSANDSEVGREPGKPPTDGAARSAVRNPQTAPANTNSRNPVAYTLASSGNASARAANAHPNGRTPGAYTTAPPQSNGKRPGAYTTPAQVDPGPRASATPPAGAQRRFQGPTFSPHHQELMTRRLQALRSRALMARQLANFISTLKTYSQSDPGAKIEEAANNLGGAVASLVPIPGVATAVPLLAGFAGDLKRWQQYKNIKEQMKVVQSGLSKVREFYDQEAGAYTSIAQENSNVATAVMQELIRLELVTSWGVFKHVPEPYGMKWTDAVVDEPEKRADFKSAFIAVIRLRNERFMANAKGATESLQEALAEFDSKITDFLNKKTVSWDNTLAALGRAKFYVKEINTMRNGKENDE